jgi:membrane-associated phospholipid phosphatase
MSSTVLADDAKLQRQGDIMQLLIPAVAYGSTFYMDDAEGRMQFYKSAGTAILATHLLKNTTDVTRPDGSDNKSFPSGHTSAAFQGASFIHYRYGWKYSVPAYIGAAFVGYSRVETKKHYMADVVAGAALGIAANWYFTTPYKNKVLIVPHVSSEGAGITLTAAW